MELYKNKIEYHKRNNVHIQTVNNREKIWRLLKVTVAGKKVWYLDIYEANLILAQLIKK